MSGQINARRASCLVLLSLSSSLFLSFSVCSGVLSTQLSGFDFRDSNISDCAACSGGAFSINGGEDGINIRYSRADSLRAWSGGFVSLSTVLYSSIQFNVVSNVLSRAAGGAIVSQDSGELRAGFNTFTNVSCVPWQPDGTCDGGVFWLTDQRIRIPVLIAHVVFNNYEARQGAGVSTHRKHTQSRD